MKSNESLRGLALTYRGVVYPWQCDHMGHMNVMWYAGKLDEATWQLVSLMGVTPAYMREHQRGMAAVEQNIRYKHELRPGDLVAIYSGIVEIKEKSIRFVHELRNEETGEVAAVTVITGVHMDMKTRRACPFPEEIATRGKEVVIEEPLSDEFRGLL
jgi:acyl-CoA thioester hydrolase